jgi:VRR-NUC domain
MLVLIWFFRYWLKNVINSFWNKTELVVQNENIALFQSLYMCMGPDAVTKICLKLLKDYRNSRAGFPDLVVWSPGVENVNHPITK